MAGLTPTTPSISELTSQEACGTYFWEIESEQQVSDFLGAPNGKRLKSVPFSIGKLQWLLEAFPNGDREDNIGSFMVYLTLIALPQNWQRVTFLLKLFNSQTCSSFTGIASYSKTSNSGGWSDGTMLLQDLQTNLTKLKCNAISLGCKIHILQLIGSKNSEILYEYQLQPKHIQLMKSPKPIFEIKWDINNALLDKFKSANVGKKFESDIFYETWSLRCAPNGKRENDKNNVKLYLLLCALPPSIVHCKVKYTLSCEETQATWTNVREFSYKYPNVGWPNDTMHSSDLDSKYSNLKQLTFRAKIEILKLYDHDIVSSSDSSDSEEDEDEDEDDDDDDSSSFDTSEAFDDTENDDLGDINAQILPKTTKTARRKSFAKKSAIRQRQSQELTISPSMLPKISAKQIKQSHLRQETDVVSSAKPGGVHSPSPQTPGFLMKSSNVNNPLQKVLEMDENTQFNYDIVDEIKDDDTKRSRASTMIEVQATTITENTNSNDNLSSLTFHHRLLSLENHFRTLSQQFDHIDKTLSGLNLNEPSQNRSTAELFKVLTDIKLDICLIKNKVIANGMEANKNQKIKQWLTHTVTLPQYIDLFVENGLDDMDIIKELNENELIDVGVTKLGHRKKILKCIRLLNNTWID